MSTNNKVTFKVPAGLTPNECTLTAEWNESEVRMTCSCERAVSGEGCPHFLEVLTCSRDVVTNENADAICELLTKVHGSETVQFAKEILIAKSELESAMETFESSCKALTQVLQEGAEIPDALRLLRSPRLPQVKIPIYDDGMPDVMELD